MNYFKSALAGFGMSFIGTALCSSKCSEYQEVQYKELIKKRVLYNLFQYKDEKVVLNQEKHNIYTDYNFKFDKEGYADFSEFKFDEYYNNNFKQHEINYWLTLPRLLLIKNAYFIPTSLLGALFHDKVGRDLTPKINEYFGSEMSPYLVTGALFGGVSTFLMIGIRAVVNCIKGKPEELTKPFFYFNDLSLGSLLGGTAMAGAYFGDEEPEKVMASEIASEEVDANIL